MTISIFYIKFLTSQNCKVITSVIITLVLVITIHHIIYHIVFYSNTILVTQSLTPAISVGKDIILVTNKQTSSRGISQVKRIMIDSAHFLTIKDICFFTVFSVVSPSSFEKVKIKMNSRKM